MANQKSNEMKDASRKSARKGRRKQSRNYQDKFAKQEFEKGAKFEAAHQLKQGVTATNNPSWYFKDRKILDDVASFAFAHPLGTDIGWNSMFTSDAPHPVSTTQICAIPGLLVMKLGITPGYSVDAQSPINLGAQDLYSFVRYKNSGGSNYDPPDLMMYVIALDSLYSAWNWMKRIYGYASTYSQVNKYKPQAYAFADGVDLDDIYNHLADFRAYLNMAANRISAFACPATMTYNVRHSWLFSNIYKDAGTTKAQEYMLVPDYFYKFAEVTETSGTSLQPVKTPVCPLISGSNRQMSLQDAKNTKVLWTVSQLMDMLNSMINAMQYSEDAGIMSGDIIKAFGSNLFTLSTFEPDYRVDAVYSEEVLMQIENATLTQINPMPIKQDPNTNYITYTPSAAVAAGGNVQTYGINGSLINFHKDNPTPEDVMVATRLTVASLVVEDKLYFQSVGSEVMTGFYALYFAQAPLPTDGNLYKQGAPMYLYGLQVGGNANATEGNEMQIFRIWLWNAFDWAPALRTAIWDSNSEEKDMCLYLPDMRDWDVYTKVTYDNLESMHLLALLTEFNVPN